ncbi:hypothetical protein QFZ39_006472 [Paraburkholderia graminis]|nr:hypothetical protein [Paraburkholderia graminis]
MLRRPWSTTSGAPLTSFIGTRRGGTTYKIDEAPIDRFLDEHLPHCRCAARCRRTRADVRAALKQFFAMHGQVRLRQIPDILAAIANESDDFTLHLVEVRGLSVSTCAVLRRHVLEFLVDRFGTNSVRTSKLVPANVIRFVMHRMRALVPSAVKDIGISLRSYFGLRPCRGTPITNLIAALPRVALWRVAGLPEVLSSSEIRQLLHTFPR